MKKAGYPIQSIRNKTALQEHTFHTSKWDLLTLPLMGGGAYYVHHIFICENNTKGIFLSVSFEDMGNFADLNLV